MDGQLRVTRVVAVAAAIALLPTALCALFSRPFLALSVFEAAVLACAAAYAVFLGVYRYPR